jgi:hypothetical protein
MLRKHPLEELLDDTGTLLRLVNGESNLADLKLGKINFTLNTYRTIVKAVERVAKHLTPLKTPDITLAFIKALGFAVPHFECTEDYIKSLRAKMKKVEKAYTYRRKSADLHIKEHLAKLEYTPDQGPLEAVGPLDNIYMTPLESTSASNTQVMAEAEAETLPNSTLAEQARAQSRGRDREIQSNMEVPLDEKRKVTHAEKLKAVKRKLLRT